MRITRISLWHVPLTSHETYYMAEGKTCDTVETVVVRLDTDAGLTGWGEYCAIPHYLTAYARGVARRSPRWPRKLSDTTLSGRRPLCTG